MADYKKLDAYDFSDQLDNLQQEWLERMAKCDDNPELRQRFAGAIWATQILEAWLEEDA